MRTKTVRATRHRFVAPPAAVTIEELPAALLAHECSALCRADTHSLPLTVPADTPWSHVDAAAAIAGVRAAIGRAARPHERRSMPAPGWRTDVLVWSDR